MQFIYDNSRPCNPTFKTIETKEAAWVRMWKKKLVIYPIRASSFVSVVMYLKFYANDVIIYKIKKKGR